jgi:hypothetical protein
MNINNVGITEYDRIDYILELIGIWREKDPKLEDRNGFNKLIEKASLGRHPVLNTKTWLNYSKEARKKRKSVAEIIFEKSKTSYKKKQRDQVVTDVLRPTQAAELRDISERIRASDPMRKKS